MIFTYIKSLFLEYSKIKFSTFSDALRKVGGVIVVSSVMLILLLPVDTIIFQIIKYILIK